jgi:hypothetical protein
VVTKQRSVLVLVALALVPSCKANLRGGVFVCGDDDDCPPGLTCVAGFCEPLLDSGPPAPDGGGRDAGVDAGTRQENTAATCADAIDNDSDGFTDCFDFGCCGEPACSGAPACACAGSMNVNVTAPPPPTIVFLLDRSSSFNDTLSDGMRKWDALRQLFLVAGSVLDMQQGRVRFGLFARDPGMPLFGCGPIAGEIPAALGNYPAISTAYSAMGPPPSSGGFEFDAIQELFDRRPFVFGSPITAPSVIVLITDSEPVDCNGMFGLGPATTILNNFRAAEGVRTHVVGLGAVPNPNALDQMAAAGGTGVHTRATNTGELVAAVLRIVSSEHSCMFTLERPIDPVRGCEGTVTLDGSPLACSTTDGWSPADASSIVLVGSACLSYQESGTGAITAAFPCDVVQ